MTPVPSPFPTIAKLAAECGATWSNYDVAVEATGKAEKILIQVLNEEEERLLDSDSSLVLCGSFARHEMVPDSDCDWTLLINGVVSNKHAQTARTICRAIAKADHEKKGIKAPGTSGTFGNMSFSHELVHRIGGGSRLECESDSTDFDASGIPTGNAIGRRFIQGGMEQRGSLYPGTLFRRRCALFGRESSTISVQ